MKTSHTFEKRFRFAVLILATLFTVVAARSEVLTSFLRTALSDQNPEGWRFARNPAGPLEEVAKYSDLTIVESRSPSGRRNLQRGVLDGDGVLRTDGPSLSSNGAVNTPSGLADGPKRYLIASYTMPLDSQEVVWMDGSHETRFGCHLVGRRAGGYFEPIKWSV